MARYSFSAPRLLVAPDIQPDIPLQLDRNAGNYLLTVLRLPAGAEVLIFNGRDGEWRATLGGDRKRPELRPVEQVRPQEARPDVLYLFAPLKHARLDYMVQKAVEMGAGALRPVFTRRTVAARINLDRMRANVVEAAEQCGILAVPEVLDDLDLSAALRALPAACTLVLPDEDAPVASPLEALNGIDPAGGLAVLVGPEGGFAPEEREVLLARPGVRRISLGPRILRADTAAVAALALVGAAVGVGC